MLSTMAPSDILPPKRQAVVERLRRRMENYRKHQNECIPRFDYSFNSVVEQNMQDTLLLKKNFLDNKVKKGSKKSEKKDMSYQNSRPSPQQSQQQQQPQKVEINTKFMPNNSQESPKQENMTKLSVQIVQQLEFTTSSSNSQVSTNVTVKTVNTSVKSETPHSSPAPSPAATTSDPVKCKKEPENSEFVDLEQCAAALEKDAAANGTNSFSAFPDLIGDSSDLITSEAFKDLISEIDFNPEFMRDFDFDNKNQKHTIKIEPDNNVPLVQKPKFPPPTIDFSNPEMSPAAQTLKQMAEQHQHKTQIGHSFNPRPPDSNTLDFQFNKAELLNNQNFQFRQQNSPRNFNTDNIKQENLPGQSSPKVFRMSPNDKLGSQYKPYYTHDSENFNSRQLPRGTFQMNQAQQIQAQGPVRISMAQKLDADIKEANLSLGSSQSVYMTSNQDSCCSASQTQSISFDNRGSFVHTQQQPVNVMNQIRPDMNRFQIPMMRYPQRMQQPMYNQYPHMNLPYRPQPVNAGNWRRPLQDQFMQAQGISFVNNDTRLGAGQIQLGNLNMPQQQRLAMVQQNANSSLRVEMEQKMERSPQCPQPQSNPTNQFSEQPFVGIPPDFNLDFLDLPSGDSSTFSEQDFLNSL
ncbi:neurogenic protein mastermind-like [Cimex lectularius]|uniref:Neurogenic mastermind-like N-terminal domain-containing protein n=1 Tax=Cimex lectularius TaxID=79782 RepID=A0A8I6S415_CIMLE|nr:neurogenic protein mastermind-like [Cimex lectularius]